MAGRGGYEGLGADPVELEEEMKIEWVTRGLPPNDFTVDELEEIWDREEREREYLSDRHESNLSVKLSQSGAPRFDPDSLYNDNRPFADKMKELMKKSIAEAKVQGKVLAFKAGRVVEPPFARKLRLAKEHHERINQQQTESTRLFDEKEKVRKVRRRERLLEIKADRKRREKVQYEKPLKERAQQLEDEYKLKDKIAYDEKIKSKRFEYIKKIRKEEAKRRRLLEIRKTQALVKHRDFMAKRLKRLAREEEQAVVELLAEQEKEMRANDGKAAREFQREDHDFEKNNMIEMMGIPQLSAGPPRLGIFGKPLDQKSYSRTGHLPGVDDATVGMSFAGNNPTNAAFEERKTALYDLEGKEAKLSTEYRRLRRVQEEAEEERLTLVERLNKVSEDIAQHEQEQADFEEEIGGVGQRHVGRRLAYRFERVTVHERKERVAELNHEKKDLETRCVALGKERDQAASKELRIAPRLAVIRDKKTKAVAGMKKEEEMAPSLPMVIGRSIREVPSLRKQMAASKREIRDVLLGSKLEILKVEAKQAEVRAKELTALNHEEWKAKHRREEQRAVVELGEARLGNILRRLQTNMKEQASGDIQGAVQKFWRTDKLKQVNIVHEGWLDWWSNKDPAQTVGVQQWNIENVILGGTTFGVIQGRIEFPKMGLWQVDFLVTKADELAPMSGDPNDFITVRMGGSAMSLDLVGKFNNVRAPGQAGVRYVVSKQYQGMRFTYRFEMASSNENVDDHMIVMRGRYRQIEQPPLEVTDAKKGKVLSSYVKMLRLQRKQGKARGTILLEELIKLEKAGDDVKYWDSLVVNGHFQRFKKEQLADYLRDELKRQMGMERKRADREAKAKAEREAAEKARSDAVNDDNHAMASVQFKNREIERARRITELEHAEKEASGETGGEDEFSSKEERDMYTDEPLGEPRRWPRSGVREPHASAAAKPRTLPSSLPEEPESSDAAGNPGVDDGSAVSQPAQRGVPDRLPNIQSAVEDGAPIPEEGNMAIVEYENEYGGESDEEGSYSSEESKDPGVPRPQTADLVFALKSMRRARERRRSMKISENQKRYKESQLEKKLRASQRAFIMRKRRGIQVDLEMARELVGSRLEIYFTEEQRWRLGSVVEMRVQWTHGGTQLEVLHSVCYYGAEGRPIQWENLTSRRFVGLKSDMASVDARRAVMEEKRRRREEIEKKALSDAAEREMKILRDAEAKRLEEGEQLRAEMRADMSKVIADAKREVDDIIDTPIMIAEFESQVEQIVENWKNGIGTDDGFAQFLEPQEAFEVAKRDYRIKTIAIARVKCREKWETIWAGKKEEARMNREAEAKAAELRRQEDERVAEESRQEYLEQVALERELMRSKLKIPNFEKATPPVTRCEHIDIKFWATLYGKGVKCKTCGMELTKSHEDLSQLCTVDAETEDAIQRHRTQEHGAFRFKDGGQLRLVLQERERTEKEERLVMKDEPGFYDYNFEKGVEEMYGRHQYTIRASAEALADEISRREAMKLAGTEDLPASQQVAMVMKVKNPGAAGAELDQVVGTQAETFMGGMLVEPVPVRDFLNKRKARHKDILQYYARLNIYTYRIEELHGARTLMKTHKATFSRRLGQCHGELVFFEERMALVEKEHSRCESILERRYAAQKAHNEAVFILEEATKQLYIAAEQRAQTDANALLTEQEHKELELQVREMLTWREWASDQKKQAEEELKRTTLNLETAEEFMEASREAPERLHYCRRGQTLFTSKWGRLRVLFYRPGEGEDEMGEKTAYEQRLENDAEAMAKQKALDLEKEAEARRIEEANNPDILFKWLCKFCGRTNKRIDLRCRGCDTKKPLAVVRAEAAFMEEKRRLKNLEDMRAEEQWQRDLMEQQRLLAIVQAGWNCTICGCLNDQKSEKCKDCGRMGRPKEFTDALEEEKRQREREERAKKLSEPMPPTLVVMPGGGWPASTKIYLPVDSIVTEYQSLREAENLSMAAEDAQLKAFYANEKVLEAKEAKLMKVEDTNMQYLYRWERWEKEIMKEVKEAKKVAAAAAPDKLNTKSKQSDIKDAAKTFVEEEEVRRLKEFNSWDGKGKRPSKLSRVAKFKLRRATVKRLKKEFLDNEEAKAEKKIRQKWQKKEDRLIEDEQGWNIMLDVVDQVAREVGREVFNGSVQARERAETDSGVVFESRKNKRGIDIPMHHSVYMRLLRVQNGRAMELRESLKLWGKSLKLVLEEDEPEETEEQKARRLALEERRKLEKAEREAMQVAEEETRQFYQDELRQTLKERRGMRDAENERREYLKQYAFYNKKSKYDVTGGEPKQKPSAKQLRREAMKKKTAERQRIKRELEGMSAEDELGRKMQLEDMRLRQEAQMKAELAFDDESSSDDDIESEDGAEDEDEVDFDSDDSSDDEDELPEVPPGMQHFTSEVNATREIRRADKKALLRAKRKLRRKQRQGKPPTAADRAKLESRLKFAKASADLAIAVQKAVMNACRAELNKIQCSNEYFMAMARSGKSKENMTRVNFHSRKRNNEEQRVRVIARKQRQLADEALAYEQEQLGIVAKYTPETRRLLIIRRNVEADTKFTDTLVLHGRFQRFETDVLYKELHYRYFYILAQTLATRAELSVIERRLLLLQEAIRANAVVYHQKRVEMKVLRREHARDERMRLRKSVLGQDMFRKSQLKCMEFAFKAWTFWWRGYVGKKKAFQLRYSLVKHDLDLRRITQEERAAERRKLHGVAGYNEDGGEFDKSNEPSWAKLRRKERELAGLWEPEESITRPNVPRSLLKTHQNRKMKCVHCCVMYSEVQNHSSACEYHSGEFSVMCPRACPFRGKKADPVKCIAHYKRRWSCCDSTLESEFGIGGCQKRWHVARGEDKGYRILLEHEEARDLAVTKELSAAMKEADSALRENRKQGMGLMNSAIAHLKSERDTVERYKNLKWQ
jgi:hypothetical protein